MTDSEPHLTREEEARVRRLLADARHDEPMPPEVVARLEGVLAGLADEARGPEAPVTALATRRRRAARLLVAAAAVVVVGIGLGQVVGLGDRSADDGGAPTADSEVAQEDASPEEAAPQSGGYSSDSDSRAPEAHGLPDPDAPVVTIRPQAFAAGARLARDYSSGALDTRSELSGEPVAGLSACRTDAWGAGTLVPVRYGRAPAVLVLRRAAGETQVADLFLCGETDPVRSVTLPAP